MAIISNATLSGNVLSAGPNSSSYVAQLLAFMARQQMCFGGNPPTTMFV